MKKAKYSNDSILQQEKIQVDHNFEILQKIEGVPDSKTKDSNILLWSKMKEGEVTALGDLYDLYIDDLFPYGLVLCSDKDLVMDCIHDLFVDLFKYRKKLTKEPQVKYYLLKSLKRKIYKRISRKTKIEEVQDHNLADLNLFETSDENKMIDNEIDGGLKDLVARAIDSLPKKQKIAIQMKFFQGKSYEEIAVSMDIAIETARTLIYRSILNLRKTINNPFLDAVLILSLL